MKRRDFVKKTAIAGGSVAALSPLANNLSAQEISEEASSLPDLVAVHGGEPAEMFEKGIAAIGGMARFVKKGDRVVLKPNIGWDRTPEYGSNTHPELIRAVIKHCFASGAKEVSIFDHTCGNDWENRYALSGIEKVAKEEGAQMVPGNTESFYSEAEIPRGVSLKKAKVHALAKNPDVFINIPVLKHHSGAKITAAMKNYMGCIWDRRWWHGNDMPQCIADYASFQKTSLNIVDAYRVMLEHGPRGRSPEFAPVVKYQIISTDIVAVDAAATQIFSAVAKQHGKGTPYAISDIKYLEAGEKLGLGTTDLSKLKVKRINIA